MSLYAPLMRTGLMATALVLTGAGVASAQGGGNPHFLFADASINSTTGALCVSFKEVGLGNTAITETVTLQVANAAAVYQCYNKPGNKPAADNKTSQVSGLTSMGTFPVRNGQTTGTICTGPVGTEGFTCPSGQVLFLDQVAYQSITLTGSAGDTAPEIGGTIDGTISNTSLHLRQD